MLEEIINKQIVNIADFIVGDIERRDKYAYRYHSNEVYGDMESVVHIQTNIKGENIPSFAEISPPVH